MSGHASAKNQKNIMAKVTNFSQITQTALRIKKKWSMGLLINNLLLPEMESTLLLIKTLFYNLQPKN
jgi:hypothetical protein